MFWWYYISLLFQHKIKKMFSLACDTGSYFLCSPSTHLQLHAVHSIMFFSPLLSALWSFWVFFQVRELYFGTFWILVCVHVSVCALFCPWIYKRVPSISSFHRHAEVSVEDRSLSLCASLNCRLVFPIFLPKGEQEHISHICGRSSLLVFPLP